MATRTSSSSCNFFCDLVLQALVPTAVDIFGIEKHCLRVDDGAHCCDGVFETQLRPFHGVIESLNGVDLTFFARYWF